MTTIDELRAAQRFPVGYSLHPARREELRRAVYKRERGRCYWCNCRVRLHWKDPGVFIPEDAATLDHIVPLSKGGNWDVTNLLLCCPPCNRRRGNMDAAEYLASIAQRAR